VGRSFRFAKVGCQITYATNSAEYPLWVTTRTLVISATPRPERWNSHPSLDLEYDLQRCAMSRAIIALTAAFALSAVSVAFSQSNPSDPSTNTNPSGNVTQPQKTGPLNTKSGGAPASSPQGETPPGMQSAPKGSDKTIRTDGKDVPEGTPKE
jgi:hypothetical protein